MQKRALKFTAYKWAYAAAAAIILSFGIVYYSNYKPDKTIAVNEFNTDSLSTAEIITALKKSEIAEDELIKNIDTKEITARMAIEEKDVKNIIDELEETDLEIDELDETDLTLGM